MRRDKMTQIVVMSRDRLEHFAYESFCSYAIISVTDPNSRAANINVDNVVDHCVLGLQFYDIDNDYGKYLAMTEEQAGLIAELVKIWYGNYDVIIVQCEAGISRSAGIAAAIAKWATGDDSEYFDRGRYIPNRRCYRLVLERLMENDQ